MAREARTANFVHTMFEYLAAQGAVEKATEAARGAVEVRDEASAARAAEVLTVVSKTVKTADKQRLEASAPYRRSSEVINQEFRELVAPLEAAEESLKAQFAAFQREQRRIAEEARVAAEKAAREAEEKARREAEEAAKAGEPEPPAPAPAPAPTPPQPPPRVRHTTSGSVSMREAWKYEIIDEVQLPREYLKPDPGAVQRAVKDGVREIPGVKIWSEEVPTVR